MSYSRPNSALNQYSEVKARSSVAYASPHRLIQMLFQGALDKIASAKGHMLRGELAQKAGQISAAMAIVGGLRMSLDKSAGDIAEHLDSLYDYLERQLLRANYENDAHPLDEVAGLLQEIKGAWDAIADSAGSAKTAELHVQAAS
ncbi:MAG: flagellar export chaperone FliS [Gammaproteobacteria bacterium]|nr:flagellar export chaperone FliS [Gammaproteobacteria bacterium]